MPELDLKRLSEDSFNDILVNHVEFYKVCLENFKPLHLDFLEQQVKRVLGSIMVGGNKLGLEHLTVQLVLEEESLHLSLLELAQVKSALEQQLDEVDSKNKLLALVGPGTKAKLVLAVKGDRLVYECLL